MGLVSQVFDESTLESLKGHLAIGHSRYSTTGASTWQNAQPTFRPTADGSIALGHNGNLINTHELAQMVADLPDPDGELPLQARDVETSTNDTGLVTALLAHHPDTSLEQRALEVLPLLRGRLLLRLDERGHALRRPRPAGHPPAGARSPRPRLGRRQRGRRARHHRRQRGPRGRARRDDRHRRGRPALATGSPSPSRKGCVFEYVYLARPDATISGRSVHEARVEMGRQLAREFPVDADLVMPVPESGTPAAAGYAEESGIPFGQGFVKNAYVGRTFIQPSQTLRQLGIRLKLNAARAHDPRQAHRGRRRLDRARQHPARPGPDAARGGRPRGARPDLQPAGEVAVLLRHRLRHPRRADRQRPRRPRRSPPASGPTPSATSRSRG